MKSTMNGTTLTKVIGFESGPVPLTNGTGGPKNLRSNHTGRIRPWISTLTRYGAIILDPEPQHY
jgi:hypothetical protein